MPTSPELKKLVDDLPRIPEWKAMEQRAEKAIEQAQTKLVELAAQLQKYPSLGAMPSGLQADLMAQLTLAATVGLIFAGKEATVEAFEGVIAKAKAEGQPTADPFMQARDAHLEASAARYEIESHLNSLSQGGIEQLAQALREGAQLRAVLRR